MVRTRRFTSFIFAMMILSAILLTGCLALNTAILRKDTVSPEWISANLGPRSRKAVYVNIEGDFNDTLRIYKENVIQDASLSGAEKEKLFEIMPD